MNIREPVVTGQFYPARAEQCRHEVEDCLGSRPIVDSGPVQEMKQLLGGVVPHAGWICSGSLAAEVIRLLAADSTVETFVIFGAAHRPTSPLAAVYADGAWGTPLGTMEVDAELARAVLAASDLFFDSEDAHDCEHSIEVQIPFIRYLRPALRILPILVPPTVHSHTLGTIVAEQVAGLGRRAVFLGSTDLTHYGPRYGFTPQGADEQGLQWARKVNDRRIIDLMLNLQADKVVTEAAAHHNACGSGAVAAAMAAGLAAGADRAELIGHTTSNDVLSVRYGKSLDAVGYAGIVFGKA